MSQYSRTLLLTGAKGGLAKLVAESLQNEYHIVGVDPRPLLKPSEFPGDYHSIDYRHRKMSEIFRNYKFDAFLHLGRVPVTDTAKASERYNLNVIGTKNLLEHARQYQIPKVLVMSSFHVYGAHPHNHLYISEDDPLKASQTYPELADAVEMDNLAVHFMLRHPEIKTFVLRPTNVIGPTVYNHISRLLRSELVPYVMGYDPMQQFIHEQDLLHAIRLCLGHSHSDVFNIAGEGIIPFSKVIEIAGSKGVPIPSILQAPISALLRLRGIQIQKHLIDFYKYPTIISDKHIRQTIGYQPKLTLVETISSLKKSNRS